jgi:hypothetical protein
VQPHDISSLSTQQPSIIPTSLPLLPPMSSLPPLRFLPQLPPLPSLPPVTHLSELFPQ